MNKEFIRMQKLAGLMTEGLYTSDEKAPMEGMSSEKMTKEKLKAKIKEMMTPMPDEDTDETEEYYDTDYDGSYSDGYIDDIDTEFDLGIDEATIGQEAEEEMGSMDEASYEGMERMDGLAPRSAIAAFIGGAERIILALKRDGFEDDDIHSYLIELITELPTSSEAMFEAKKDEESDTEEVIVADTAEEVPAEDAAVDVTADETKVDVNMDGIPDVDTGSAESKKAFTSLVDTYNSAKELGDPKLTQMIANALTYYNKNIILKSGQPQA
jgi:hypothetical protein